jgi:hypothetical protein
MEEKAGLNKQSQTVNKEWITLIMKSVGTSEMSVNFYKTIQHNIPEGCHLHGKE